MDVCLEFTDLYRNFGRVRVLRGVSGRAESGQLLLVTGDNGSGKSTLLRCLAGLMQAQRGEVRCQVAGKTLSLSERRRTVGYSSPDLQLYGELSALENLVFFARLRGLSDGAERGAELLDRLGLPAGREAAALSSGMRQRLRLAWAVLHRPPVLLLDEPMQNLDAAGRRDVRTELESQLAAGALVVVANPDPMDLPRVDEHVELAG